MPDAHAREDPAIPRDTVSQNSPQYLGLSNSCPDSALLWAPQLDWKLETWLIIGSISLTINSFKQDGVF